MVSALTDFRLKLSPPDVLIRPELPADMDLFIGFHRPKVAIEAGERAAEAALPQILAAPQLDYHYNNRSLRNYVCLLTINQR